MSRTLEHESAGDRPGWPALSRRPVPAALDGTDRQLGFIVPMKRTSMLVNGLLADLTNKGTRFGGSFTIIGVGALLLELFNIGRRLEALRTDLAGDVKKLTARTHEYRLRVGDFRVLFMLEGDLISAYAVKDRKEAYG